MNKHDLFSSFHSDILGERYYSYRHPSGLTVIVFPKKLTTAYVIMGVNCGSLNTNATAGEEKVLFPEGVAHFIEHKLFTNEDGSDAFERFSDYGADANAYTSFNRTAYLFSCTENFEQSLGELIDLVTHPFFTEESVESEKPIITEEIKMYDDSPSEVCLYGMLEGMYVNNRVKNNICGSPESILAITPETLYEFYRSFYKLSNLYLIVCGDISPDTVLKTVDIKLSDRPYENAATSEPCDEPRAVASEHVKKRMPVSKPIFSIGFKDTSIPDNVYDRYRKDAGMAILNEMLFSRATNIYSLLYSGGYISSPSLSYGYTITQEFAYNFISGESDKPIKVLDKIKEYLHSTVLSEEDFERGKRVMYAEFVKCFDSSESIANTLLSFAGDGAEIFEYGDILNDISFEEMQLLFKELKEMPITLCEVAPL